MKCLSEIKSDMWEVSIAITQLKCSHKKMSSEQIDKVIEDLGKQQVAVIRDMAVILNGETMLEAFDD